MYAYEIKEFGLEQKRLHQIIVQSTIHDVGVTILSVNIPMAIFLLENNSPASKSCTKRVFVLSDWACNVL